MFELGHCHELISWMLSWEIYPKLSLYTSLSRRSVIFVFLRHVRLRFWPKRKSPWPIWPICRYDLYVGMTYMLICRVPWIVNKPTYSILQKSGFFGQPWISYIHRCLYINNNIMFSVEAIFSREGTTFMGHWVVRFGIRLWDNSMGCSCWIPHRAP